MSNTPMDPDVHPDGEEATEAHIAALGLVIAENETTLAMLTDHPINKGIHEHLLSRTGRLKAMQAKYRAALMRARQTDE